MPGLIRRKSGLLFDDGADHFRSRMVAIYSALILFNIGCWSWAAVSFRHYPVLLGTALLAYSFGLRHAVDADHIAAIDNVTRKLMQDGRRPVAVGFMFSLGHSTIVILGSMAIAGAGAALQHRIAAFRNVAGVAGTLISTGFLFAIATVNLIVLRSIYQVFVEVRRGRPCTEEDSQILLAGPGIASRIFGPLFRMIRSSWHMYPLGLLFGLGFDTATEIGVLGIAAMEGTKGLPLQSIMIFPLLFTAGMSLVDTTDNLLMIGAYGWAFVKPIRRLYYNLTVTGISVIVAFVVGGIEVLGLIADRFHLRGLLWDAATKLSNNLGTLGYLVIALFALCWVVAVAVYKWRRFADLEVSHEASSSD